MLITEKKLRKIIKNVISENYEENEYYSSGSSLEDSLEQGNPDPERYSFDNHGYEKDIKHPEYTKVNDPVTGEVFYVDEVTDEIMSEDEFNKRIGNLDFDYPPTYDEDEINTSYDMSDMPAGGYN